MRQIDDVRCSICYLSRLLLRFRCLGFQDWLLVKIVNTVLRENIVYVTIVNVYVWYVCQCQYALVWQTDVDVDADANADTAYADCDASLLVHTHPRLLHSISPQSPSDEDYYTIANSPHKQYCKGQSNSTNNLEDTNSPSGR